MNNPIADFEADHPNEDFGTGLLDDDEQMPVRDEEDEMVTPVTRSPVSIVQELCEDMFPPVTSTPGPGNVQHSEDEGGMADEALHLGAASIPIQVGDVPSGHSDDLSPEGIMASQAIFPGDEQARTEASDDQ